MSSPQDPQSAPEESQEEAVMPTEGDYQQAAKERDEYREKLQRALADQENSRKRLEAERQTIRRFAVEGLVEELLPVVDNFYRATEHVPEDQKESPWVTGIQYIQKNLLDVLEQQGVTEIAVKPGDMLDTQVHEAIGTIESDKEAEGTIAEVALRGYRLHEKVLRPARVTVYKSATQEETK